jgi:hypothetical protein
MKRIDDKPKDEVWKNEVKRMRLQRGKKDKVVMNNSKALCFIIDDD